MGVKVNEYHLMKGPPIMIQHIHVVLKIFNSVIKFSECVSTNSIRTQVYILIIIIRTT